MKAGFLQTLMRRPALIVFSCLLLPAVVKAGDVTLQWDPNTESDLAGYKVYYGTASRTYGTPVSVGLVTSRTITQLAPGTYYFAVTAVNTAGLESGFSNEVSATVTTTATACDPNGDTRVDAIDLQVLSNVILGLRACSGSCDTNKDGRVDVLDLQVLANVILGLRSCP